MFTLKETMIWTVFLLKETLFLERFFLITSSRFFLITQQCFFFNHTSSIVFVFLFFVCFFLITMVFPPSRTSVSFDFSVFLLTFECFFSYVYFSVFSSVSFFSQRVSIFHPAFVLIHCVLLLVDAGFFQHDKKTYIEFECFF